MPVPLSTTAQHNQQTYSRTLPSKNVKRKSSKPIINWLQRKLGSTVRARRPSDTRNTNGSADSTYSGRGTSLKELHNTAPARRSVPAPRDVDENGHLIRARPTSTSNQISLNSTAEMSDVDDEHVHDQDDDEMSNRRSSGAATSMWGSRSNPLEADEDASIRPLPPTSPPSPSPSRSSSSYVSSSYMSDPRTFKSMSASTKPTTLLSIDLTPGVAHIAQAPPTPTSVSAYTHSGTSPITRRSTHVRTASSGYNSGVPGIITFSALPPSSPPSSRPSSVGPAMRGAHSALQAPAHTHHHPRNNPRPSSPPLDNASILTLASSAFATPLNERDYRGRTQSSGTPYSYAWAAGGDTASHISHLDGTGDSISQIVLDGDEPNASVRALRPRSARRDSWESEVSRWSAGVSVLGALGPGGRERSVRTAPSFRTGRQTLDVDESASVSLIDEDMSSCREDGLEEVEESRAETKEDAERERVLSPFSNVAVEGGERNINARISESTSTEIDETSHIARESHETETETETYDAHETDDAVTPGPAARTLVLMPSKELMPLPAGTGRTTTPPPLVPTKDIETTPKKEGGEETSSHS